MVTPTGNQWVNLGAEQKKFLLGFLNEERWKELTAEQWAAFVDFISIMDVLAVPKSGGALPTHRQWKLPVPDDKALADMPSSAAVAPQQVSPTSKTIAGDRQKT
jgi:hypothetical protein